MNKELRPDNNFPSLGIHFANNFPVRAFTFWDDDTCEHCYQCLLEINLAVELITLPEDGELAICWNDQENFIRGEVLINDQKGGVMIMEREAFKKLYYTFPGFDALGIGNFWQWITQLDEQDKIRNDGETIFKTYPIIMNEGDLNEVLTDWTEKQDLMFQLATADFPHRHISFMVHFLVNEKADFVFDVKWSEQPSPDHPGKVFLFFQEVKRYQETRQELISRKTASYPEGQIWD